MKVFIDTSAFCALTISKDQHNLKAKSLYRELQEHNPIIYTSNYVLDEVYTLLKNRASHRTAVKFMDETNKSNWNKIFIIFQLPHLLPLRKLTAYQRFHAIKCRSTAYLLRQKR